MLLYQNMNFLEELKVLLLAMVPIGEVRVAIPVGITIYKISFAATYFLAVAGNLISVLFILLCLEGFARWSSHRIYFFNRFFVWLFSKTRKNYSAAVQKYSHYFLPIFVAIPLPFTGGWTASLVAFVFGIPFKKAFPLIGIGVLVAGIITLIATKAGIVIEKYFGWQVLGGFFIFLAVTYFIFRRKKYDKN